MDGSPPKCNLAAAHTLGGEVLCHFKGFQGQRFLLIGGALLIIILIIILINNNINIIIILLLILIIIININSLFGLRMQVADVEASPGDGLKG